MHSTWATFSELVYTLVGVASRIVRERRTYQWHTCLVTHGTRFLSHFSDTSQSDVHQKHKHVNVRIRARTIHSHSDRNMWMFLQVAVQARMCKSEFTVIGMAKLTRGRCFPFTDKRVGRIMGVAIFESLAFSIIIFFNLDNISTLYNDIIIKPNSKWIFFQVNLPWLQNSMRITTMLLPNFGTLKQPVGDDSFISDPNRKLHNLHIKPGLHLHANRTQKVRANRAKAECMVHSYTVRHSPRQRIDPT